MKYKDYTIWQTYEMSWRLTEEEGGDWFDDEDYCQSLVADLSGVYPISEWEHVDMGVDKRNQGEE